MKDKKLGKIKSVRFGHGGYQSVMLGIHFTLGGVGWGVNHSECAWDAEIIECSDHAKWTEEDRSTQYDDIMRKISKLLDEANVSSIDKLQGIPVECTFENNTLQDWRILTEVI